ncbi:ATP-binding cassette domain-containing protein [Streptomyces ipomoeae]|uniref:ATP-binding cassette domain-containing protein n=1 Tax=Streptomyces ipomoeae TaxID=103232 RepID=UPI001FD14558|nr:ATP-binding cassette domain-containing protein [Streptomyces ipomoeae]MDX2935454.1 ATP-binding cassette domain-containing protein [Streptomyces ipomoeae]
MPDDDIAVRAEDLSKLHGTREAVVGVHLCAPAGRIFGLLGPNGAGRSTTIGVLCPLPRPTLGDGGWPGRTWSTRPRGYGAGSVSSSRSRPWTRI